MESIKNILKGIVIGIANIIPGVSGGTMAVSMGIYDKLIHALTHIKSEFKKSMKLIIPILIGAALAIAGLSFLLTSMAEKYPIPTSFLFIGLIVGGLPAITKKVSGKKIRISYVIAAILFFALVVGLALMGGNESADKDLTFNAVNVITLFGVGIIAAATMVIPGVSGSMILLLLGYYNPVLEAIKAFIKSAIDFNIEEVLVQCGILIPFGIGCIVGIVVIAKIMEWVFTKYSMIAFWSIIGLIVASPIGILLTNPMTYSNLLLVIVASVCTLALGFIISMKLGGE